MRWRGYRYGDPVEVPGGFAGSGLPPRGVAMLSDRSGLFVEWVKEEELQSFLERSLAGESRVLSIRRDGRGDRSRTLAEVIEASREEKLDGVMEPRTTTWCPRHLQAEGRGIDRHLEHIRGLLGLQPQQRGMQEYSNLAPVLKSLMFVDQVDPANLACPALLEAARQETEKEVGLARALLDAREARASLAKKG